MSGIQLAPEERDLFRVVQAVIQLLQGRSNAVGQVTLTPGATTTVVTKTVDAAAVNVSKDSQVFLTPRTANAAAALADTFVSAVGQGTFTLTHANNAQVDRTYGFHAIG